MTNQQNKASLYYHQITAKEVGTARYSSVIINSTLINLKPKNIRKKCNQNA